MSGGFNPGMGLYPGRGLRRPTSSTGLGGATPSGGSFDNTDADLPGDPDTVQEAVDALAALLNAGYPRPLMAYDPDLDMDFVVVSDGTAVMVTG